MRHKIFLVLFSSTLLFWIEPAFSQEFTKGHSLWMSMYFEIQKDKQNLEKRLEELKIQISNNEQIIRETNALLAEIQKAKISGDEKQRLNAMDAEKIANMTLKRAKETQEKLRTMRTELKMGLDRLQSVETRLNNLMTSMDNYSGFIKECSDAKIMNLQKKRIEDACTSYTPIQEGDILTTSSDGRVELKILDGRGNIIIGPNSTIVIGKENPEEQIFQLNKGKAYIQVEKSVEYSNKIKKFIEDYKQNLNTIKEWTDEKIEEIKKKIVEERKNIEIWLMKNNEEYNVKTPYAVIGARGTEFTLDKDGEYIGNLSVIEGEVEITFIQNNKKFVIPEGYTAIVDLKNSNVKQEKIKVIDGWWQK